MATPTLVDKLEQILNAALADGTIDRSSVRQLILGLGPTRDRLLVWASDSWDNYDSHSPGRALAAISVADFLDRTDAIVARGTSLTTAARDESFEAESHRHRERQKLGLPLEHPDPQVDRALCAEHAALRDDCLAALRELAGRQRLGETGNLVGLMLQGFSASEYADLVAFYHPDGALPLWPVHEHVHPDTDTYSWCALVPAGVRIFYPEGDEDSLAHAGGESKTRLYRFDAMSYYREDRDDREVYFRIQGDLEDVRLTHGHTHEEWGGPSQEDVDRALIAHFHTHPELGFDPAVPPLPSEAEAWARWLQLFIDGRIKQTGAAASLVERDAPAAVGELVARLPEDHPARVGLIMAWAEALQQRGQHGDALPLYCGLPADARKREWREELEALWALGDHAGLLERCAALAHEDERAVGHVLPYRAMALGARGQLDEAFALLDAPVVGKDHRDAHECAWARAYLLRHRDPPAAVAALWRSLADSARYLRWRPHDFDDAPGLTAVLAQRQALVAGAKEQVDAWQSRGRAIVAPVLPLSPPSLLAAAREAWLMQSCAKRSKEHKGSWAGFCTAGGRELLVAKETGLMPAHVADGGVEAEPLAGPSKAHHACGAGPWLYTSGWNDGVHVWWLSPEGAAHHVAALPRPFDDGTSSLALGAGWLAVEQNTGAVVYDLGDPGEPQPVSLVGRAGAQGHSPNDVAAQGDTLYLLTGDALLVADLFDRRRPRLVAHLAFSREDSPSRLELRGDLLVVKVSRRALLIDVREPQAPRPIAWLPEETRFETSVRVGEELWVLSDNQSLWRIELTDRAAPRVVAGMRLTQPGEEELRLRDPVAAEVIEGRLVVLTSDELAVFERIAAERPALPDVAAIAAQLETPFVDWLAARLGELGTEHPDFRVGMVELTRWGTSGMLRLTPPRSWATLGGRADEEGDEDEAEAPAELRLQFELNRLLPGAPSGDEEEVPDPFAAPDELPGEIGMAHHWATQAALNRLVDRALVRLTEAEAFRAIASGRVDLIASGEAPRHVVSVVDPARPWAPARPAIAERRVQTLEELLSDYDARPRLEKRLRAEAALWTELLALVRAGNGYATRAAQNLKDVDEEAVVAAVRDAVAAGRGDIEFLGGYKDRDDVRAVLEQVMAEGEGRSAKLAAAMALGRCEEDAVIEMVRSLLEDPEGDYRHADLAAETMKHIDRRIGELLPALRAWVEKAGEHENRLPAICIHLFRAGHPEAPPHLVTQARREKRDEQYHSMKSGIRALDDAEWTQNEACKAERMWRGKALAERVLALRVAGDRDSPVYPGDWEAEPFPASWNYLLQAAWPYLEAADAVGWLEETLVGHVRADERYAADQALVHRLLHHYGTINDVDHLIPLAQAVLGAPPGTLSVKNEEGRAEDDERVRRRTQRWLTSARVAKGFQRQLAGDLGEARALCDAALADEPNDAQALFLDARLCWLEQESPQAGIDRAEANFARANAEDRVGRAKLLNVAGCACDELKRWPEALGFFIRAHELTPDPMFLCNIAECHFKLGQFADAVRFASQAARKGKRTAIIEQILREHGGDDEEVAEEADDEDLVDELLDDLDGEEEAAGDDT